MTALSARPPHRAAGNGRSDDLFGHPRGLTVLFTTEMWERFSYFGMSALVVLYMVKYLFHPGAVEQVIGYAALKGALEWVFGPLERQPLASLIYGLYTGTAYFTPILGGLLADRLLGQRRTVVIGGVLMAVGHFMMTSEALFLPALLFLILGIGTFKPNISTQVGGLYAADDQRRVAAYSIFYFGINIGAFLAPLVCGSLGEEVGWHYGFGAAGVGMVIALALYLAGFRSLPEDDPALRRPRPRAARVDAHARRRVMALLVLCAPVSLFWATYDQQGNTIVLWAEDFTDRSITLIGMQQTIPTTWFLALNPLMIFVLTPLLVRLWGWQRRLHIEPSNVIKLAIGAACIALADLVMAAAAGTTTADAKAGSGWLLAYFALITIGELHLAPVGLALISRVAPPRRLSMMMGFWFATTFPGDLLGGYLGSFWSSMGKPQFFLMIAAVAALASVMIAALDRPLRSVLEG
jgi:POT family proton-dependent oligopeptide transporter